MTSLKRTLTKILSHAFTILLATVDCFHVLFAQPRTAQKPPQYVLIAYDNCTELDRWREVLAFLHEINRARHVLDLTFFVSGVNLIATEFANKYQAPRQRMGTANIDFGGSPADVAERVKYINAALAQGSEVGSHAVGHFWGGLADCGNGDTPGVNCGADWTEEEWDREFSSFAFIFDNVGKNNRLAESLSISAGSLVGFRAPQLSYNPSLIRR